MVITSPDNKIIKFLAGLSEKKHRDREKCFVIEGPNMVREALQYGGRLRFIFTRAESAAGETQQLLSLAKDAGLAVYYGTGSVYEKAAQTDSPQDILAVAEKDILSFETFIERLNGKNVLVLDRIQDPGNMGTLLRSAEAAGYGGVILVKGCQDVYAPKVVRASTGSILRLPLYFADTSEECISLLKAFGYALFVTAMEGSTAYYRAAFNKSALVIGNEGNGVSVDFINNADKIISIPMEGRTESLNAGLAGGIIMFEALRQRRMEENK